MADSADRDSRIEGVGWRNLNQEHCWFPLMLQNRLFISILLNTLWSRSCLARGWARDRKGSPPIIMSNRVDRDTVLSSLVSTSGAGCADLKGFPYVEKERIQISFCGDNGCYMPLIGCETDRGNVNKYRKILCSESQEVFPEVTLWGS
jgi:hypothetical protein